MVECSGQRCFPSSPVLSWRWLLFRLDPQPSAAGRAAKVRTLAIAYRLAPEHPYPAALDDAHSAWRFLRQAGIAAAHIAIGGDSAGGGLTAALIDRLKVAGEELPGCAW